MKSPAEHSEVVIVGGGPVGLTLALVLARLNVRSLVIEERSEATSRDESRAITWQPRGIELLEWLGIDALIAERSVKRTTHRFETGSREAFTLRFDRVASPHRYARDLPQGDSEAVLEAAASATGLVEIRRGHEAIGIETWEEAARVRVRSAAGQTYLAEAPWGAICDGYHSPMREALGIGSTRKDYGADSAVADFECSADILPIGVSNIVLDSRRPYGFFRFGTDRWRMIYRVNRGENRKEMTEAETVLNLIRARAGKLEIGRILWASAFRLGQQQSDSYRKGRWLLVGDAAHGMGPSAGAGLQVGAIGAWRLGWRLALAAAGHPLSNVLLDDYAREQRAASDQVQFENELIFRNLALRSPLLVGARARLLALLGRVPAIERSMTENVSLVGQHVPSAPACDWASPSNDGRSIRRHGDWRAGYRVPPWALDTWPALRTAHPAGKHAIIPVSGYNTEHFTSLTADRSPVPAVAERMQIKTGGASVVAIVRPDQEVAALLRFD